MSSSCSCTLGRKVRQPDSAGVGQSHFAVLDAPHGYFPFASFNPRHGPLWASAAAKVKEASSEVPHVISIYLNPYKCPSHMLWPRASDVVSSRSSRAALPPQTAYGHFLPCLSVQRMRCIHRTYRLRSAYWRRNPVPFGPLNLGASTHHNVPPLNVSSMGGEDRLRYLRRVPTTAQHGRYTLQ